MIVRDVPAAARPLPWAPLPLPRPLPRPSPLPTVDVFGFIPVEYIYTMFSSFHKLFFIYLYTRHSKLATSEVKRNEQTLSLLFNVKDLRNLKRHSQPVLKTGI